MIVRGYLVGIVVPPLVPLLVAGLAPACGGKTTLGASVGDCVDLVVLPSDLSCGSDSDCELVGTGEVCSGQCDCGDTPVNAAAAARFESDTASLTLEGCPCDFGGEARCLGGQCTLCGLGPDQPAGCGDAGTAVADAGTGTPGADAEDEPCYCDYPVDAWAPWTDAAIPPGDAETPEADTGTPRADAMPACVEATVGTPCTPVTSTPCSQPANPCEAGYIWSCDNATSLWIQERIVCFTQPNGTTTTTAACGDGEVLFVDDVAGDPCFWQAQQGTDASAGECPSGSFLFEPNCCTSATNAYCVPAPAACSNGLTCDCANEVCISQCGGVDNPGVMCTNAGNSVVDCLCGKF